MRRWILFGLFAAMTLPVGAAKRVTVAQLEQALAAASAAHKTDAEMARIIAGMELSERLGDGTLERLDARLGAGPKIALAMQLLADQSAFLDLPASELPAIAAPDQAAQLRMFDTVAHYVNETMSRLPNFLATRTTNRFDDSPQETKKGAWPVRAGLHQVDRSSREVSVHVERENEIPGNGSAVWENGTGLSSWGEFGTVLGMILGDAVKGKVSWSHWEQTASGLSAVFRYSVPKSASHFEVLRFIQRPGTVTAVVTAQAYGSTRASSAPLDALIAHDNEGYEGYLWIDPATGTILRITIEANSNGNAAYQQSAMLVQYGAVEIGGSRFILPVRSLALSEVAMSAEASTGDAPSKWLNETLFTGYHRFASTTRILTGDQTPQ
jgi:hypothetical protein